MAGQPCMGGGSSPLPGQTTEDRQRLEARVVQLRRSLADASPASEASLLPQLLELALSLQHLDHLSPDGGRRLPEAEAAYRRVLAGATAPEALMAVHANLAAVLMSGGRTSDALGELEAARALAVQHGALAAQMAGILFNKGKALSMQGGGSGAAVEPQRRMPGHVL